MVYAFIDSKKLMMFFLCSCRIVSITTLLLLSNSIKLNYLFWTLWQEQLEKKKAEYGERMKNKIAMIHKQAEEKRAMVEAKRGEENLKAEEIAAKHRATGTVPKKLLGCF